MGAPTQPHLNEIEIEFESIELRAMRDADILFEEEAIKGKRSTSVLVVEDDLATASLIKFAICKALKTKCRVKSFASGERAWDYLLSLKNCDLPGPDIAIVDYLLVGEVDGIWVCKLIEEIFPETQTILTSSFSYDKLEKEIHRYHAHPLFIPKPIVPGNLQNLFD